MKTYRNVLPQFVVKCSLYNMRPYNLQNRRKFYGYETHGEYIRYQDMAWVENMAFMPLQYREQAIATSIIMVSNCAHCTFNLPSEFSENIASECSRWKIFSYTYRFFPQIKKNLIKTHPDSSSICLHAGFRSHSNSVLAFSLSPLSQHCSYKIKM